MYSALATSFTFFAGFFTVLAGLQLMTVKMPESPRFAKLILVVSVFYAGAYLMFHA